MTRLSMQDLCSLIDEEHMGNYYELQSNHALEAIKNREHLIITFGASIFVSSGPLQELLRLRVIALETLRFNFVMFEQNSESSYDDFGPGSVVASPEDSTQTIYDAARSSITGSLDAEDLRTVATIDNLLLYEVRRIQGLCLTLHEPSMNTLQVNDEEDYRKVRDAGKLETRLLRRGSSTIRRAEDKLRTIKTSNLIFVFSK
jgi:hypothetical protein